MAWFMGSPGKERGGADGAVDSVGIEPFPV